MSVMGPVGIVGQIKASAVVLLMGETLTLLHYAGASGVCDRYMVGILPAQ